MAQGLWDCSREEMRQPKPLLLPAVSSQSLSVSLNPLWAAPPRGAGGWRCGLGKWCCVGRRAPQRLSQLRCCTQPCQEQPAIAVQLHCSRRHALQPSAAVAWRPRGSPASMGLPGGSLAALPGSGAQREGLTPVADSWARLPSHSLPQPRGWQNIWIGQPGTLRQLCVVWGFCDIGAHGLLPCPTAALLLLALGSCTSSQHQPVFRSQIHGALSPPSASCPTAEAGGRSQLALMSPPGSVFALVLVAGL